MMIKGILKLTTACSLIMVLIFQLACTSIEVRFARAVSALPDAVKIFVPSISPQAEAFLNTAVSVANDFANSQTVGTFNKLTNSWRDARSSLVALNNSNVNKAVTLIDLLLTQVDVPVSVNSRTAAFNPNAKVTVHFDKDTVRQLEELLKVK